MRFIANLGVNLQVRDLLSKDAKNKLELKEDPERGVYVKDLTSYVVKVTHENWDSSFSAVWHFKGADDL